MPDDPWELPESLHAEIAQLASQSTEMREQAARIEEEAAVVAATIKAIKDVQAKLAAAPRFDPPFTLA